MTATLEQDTTEQTHGVGRIARVTGPVVDVEFSADSMPAMYNALRVDLEIGGEQRTLTLEVAQHIGENMVRAISMQSTDGLVRGAPVTDTGAGISVPVGDVTKGHVFNVIGDCLNLEEGEKLEVKDKDESVENGVEPGQQ